MAYTPYEWHDGSAGGTPITAERLNHIEVGLESAAAPTAWVDVTSKPATFPPQVGTTATTAKAGNYVPAWSEVTGKPATFPPVVGTTATTAKAGNYAPTWAEVTGKPTTFAPATHTHVVADVTGLQAIIDDLETRLAALESAAG